MKQLADEIVRYTEYLKNAYSLNISFHMRFEFSDRFAACPEILPYNSHINPYCTFVKGKNFEKCVRCQKFVCQKCKREKYFSGECHAGISQYIHAVENADGIMGFVSVSGYEGKKRRPAANSLYESSVIHKEVPTEFLKTVIAPLSRMLGMLMSEKPQESNDGFGKIKAFVNEYHTTVTLDMLCSALHFSKSHISHAFKANTGCTLKGYCNMLKINDAKKLLKETGLSVTEIALASGFENISYFISTFKSLTGETPLAYRKKRRQS